MPRALVTTDSRAAPSVLFQNRAGTLLNEDATRRSDRPLPSHSGRIGFVPAS